MNENPTITVIQIKQKLNISFITSVITLIKFLVVLKILKKEIIFAKLKNSEILKNHFVKDSSSSWASLPTLLDEKITPTYKKEILIRSIIFHGLVR